MDSDSFKSVIVCGQCGEWFGDMLSQVNHLTSHSFTERPGSTVGTKSVQDFIQRCEGDAHADTSPGCSWDKSSPSAEDTLYGEKDGTGEHRDMADIGGDCGESLGCMAQLHQYSYECEYDRSREHETDDIADMGDLRACLFRDGDLNTLHLGLTDQNCEDLSGSEQEVPENSRVLFLGADEDSQDGGSKLTDLEHKGNESPKFESAAEHQYEAFDVKDMRHENRSSVEKRNESIDGIRSNIHNGCDYIFYENGEISDTPVNEFKFYHSNRGENTRMGQMFNTNCQDGMKVHLNTGRGKRKYSSVEGSSKGGMDRSASLWDDALQTQSSSEQVAVRRSDSPWSYSDPPMEHCLRARGLNSAAKRQELSGEVPPGSTFGKRIPPFDQNFLENKQTKGFKRISDITPSTVDIKPEVTDTCNSSQILTVGISTCSGAGQLPKNHFETDVNYYTRSFPKQFIENRNQDYVHGRSRPRKDKNGGCNSDNLSFMLKKNPDCKGYSIYKPQVIEDGHTGESLAANRHQCSDNTNEVTVSNKKSHNYDSSLLFEQKPNDYIYNSLSQSDRWSYHHSFPVEQQSQEMPRSGESSRFKSLSCRESDQKCSICGQIFEVAGDLQKHLISHKQQCHFCGESFEELEHLNAHLDVHLKDADLASGDEGKHENDLLSCEADAPDHPISPHKVDVIQVNPVTGPQKKRYRCEICSKLFVAKHTLRIHMNIHLGRRSTCPVCKQTFSTDWSVKRHAEKYHRKVKVSEKSFSSPDSLKIQRAMTDFVKKDDGLFRCEMCEREFSSMKSLSNHHRTHQNRVEELHQYVKTFRCRECDHEYSRPDGLMAHMKVHGDRYRHCCVVCFAGFPTVEVLDSHMQQHTIEEKQLNTCSFCGIGFDLHTNLVQHIQNCRKTPHGRVLEDFELFEREKEKRSADKRFQCSVCSKMYLSKKSLKHHMKVKGHITPSD